MLHPDSGKHENICIGVSYEVQGRTARPPLEFGVKINWKAKKDNQNV